ncbi:MAG TPA: hypothetical protein VKY92_01375 [Verrucomicrobiae bacterium]|nr:hypothetical protein [Verrucomicrobiae bacterium]
MKGEIRYKSTAGLRQLLHPFAWLAGSLLLLAGCALPRPPGHVLTAPYTPQNVFGSGAALPPNVRRVGMLPLYCDPAAPEVVAGRDALEPILRDELQKTHRFEITAITSEVLQVKTGKRAWTCEDALPRDLFSWLNETKGCDAVLFCTLTVFHGYAPLAVGWKMRLVDTRTRATIWAGDEIFDANRPGVQAGARHYQLGQWAGCGPRPDEWVMENCPRQFGQYAAARLLATLPEW